MLKHGFDVNEDYESQLEAAFENGQSDGVIRFLSGANRQEMLMAFYWSAYAGHTQLLDFFIGHHQMPAELHDAYGRNILHHAAFGGQVDTIDYLVKKYKLKPLAQDLEGWGLLHFAALGGSSKGVLELEKKYSKLNPLSLSKKGFNLLHCAAQGGHLETIDELISNYSKLKADSLTKEGLNLLHCAVYAQNADLVPKLVERYGLSELATTKAGINLLHCAAFSGDVEAIPKLVKQYPTLDPMAKDVVGYGLLHYAALGGHIFAIHWAAIHYGVNANLLNDVMKLDLPIKDIKEFIGHSIKFHDALSGEVDVAEMKKVLSVFQLLHQELLMCWPIMNGKRPLNYACEKNASGLADLFTQLRAPAENPETFIDKNAMSTYYYAKALNRDRDATAWVLGDSKLVKKLVREAGSSKSADHTRALEIIMRGLGSGLLVAKKGVSLPTVKDVEMASGETSQETIYRSRQLVVTLALRLGDKETAASFTQLLCAMGPVQSGQVFDETYTKEEFSLNLLLQVCQWCSDLKHELEALKPNPVDKDSSSASKEAAITPLFSSMRKTKTDEKLLNRIDSAETAEHMDDIRSPSPAAAM